jgi:pimeloyl-ACP methyl ester carboxylesterase
MLQNLPYMQKIELRHKTFEQITYYKTGSGPAILLVHGFPANVHLWRKILPELSQHFTVLLPAFFETKGDWLKNDQTSMDLLSDAFLDILHHEQLDKIVIAGHSMGGYMGLAFATKYPEKMLGLSLIHSSSLADDDTRAEGRRKTVAILENGGKSIFLKKMVKALFTEAFNSAHPDVLARQIEESISVDDISLVAFYRAIMLRQQTVDTVVNASYPLQNIIGKKDTLANISKELASEHLAKLNFVSVFDNEAHMAMLENPQRMLQELMQFVHFCWYRKN